MSSSEFRMSLVGGNGASPMEGVVFFGGENNEGGSGSSGRDVSSDVSMRTIEVGGRVLSNAEIMDSARGFAAQYPVLEDDVISKIEETVTQQTFTSNPQEYLQYWESQMERQSLSVTPDDLALLFLKNQFTPEMKNFMDYLTEWDQTLRFKRPLPDVEAVPEEILIQLLNHYRKLLAEEEEGPKGPCGTAIRSWMRKHQEAINALERRHVPG